MIETNTDDRSLIRTVRQKLHKVDENDKKIAVIIKTFNRDRSLLRLVASMSKYWKSEDYRIYVADDGKANKTKNKLYRLLRSKKHTVKKYEYNYGATRCRNNLVSNVEEEYVLRLDDDYEFCRGTNVNKMSKILDKKEEIGVVADIEKQIGHGKGVFSSEISPFQGYLDLSNGTLYKNIRKPSNFDYDYVNGVKYCNVDFTRNFLLIRNKAFNEIMWSEKLSFAGEHLDFMLKVKQSSWNLVFTPESIHIHNDATENSIDDEKYNKDKWKSKNRINEKNIKDRYFRRKWSIEDVRVQSNIKNMIYIYAAKMYKKILNFKKNIRKHLPIQDNSGVI